MKLTSREEGWAVVIAVVVAVLLFGDWLDKSVLVMVAAAVYLQDR